MAFFRQTWILIHKNLLINFWRSWFGTLIRAFLAPIIFFFIMSYAKNFFVPPSDFGVGEPRPLRSLAEAAAESRGGRNTVVFVNNGFTGGQIEEVINTLSEPLSTALTVETTEAESDLLRICRTTIRSVSTCFAAVVFNSSPDEGDGGIWNYTIRADGTFGERAFVGQDTNDAEIYVLPLQHAIDQEIATLEGSTLSDDVEHFPFTSLSAEQRERSIVRAYMQSIIDILGIAYFIGFVGIAYQLTGQLAQERELGMSQLIEAMMPNKRRWEPQAARLLSTHIAFDMLYFPSWVLGGLIISALNYPDSTPGILVGYFILAGLALSSWSIAFASLFRKAQLSGITVVIVSIILAIIVQVMPTPSTGVVYILILLFPPMNFTLFIHYMAYFQRQEFAVDLQSSPPESEWQGPGYIFFIFTVIHIFFFPVLGAFIERTLYGTASKERKLRYAGEETNETVKITGLKKYYPQSWLYRNVFARFSKEPRETVKAVDDIDVTVLRGQVVVLLGSNGSGKSTTLDMLAGLQRPTAGTIEMEANGGIGLCPQKNVLWDELTVLEHVRIFNRLKATNVDSKETMEKLVADCDMAHKTYARSTTLSGGQKRKCQLAMMLTGGSSLCMLDEVSSGLDPLSRRKIWDIILAERGKRSMILTTHFLDEADLLSDDIVIISKGKLVANGSSVALKHELGGGYRVRIYHENFKELPSDIAYSQKQVYHDQTVYRLADSAAAAKFVVDLERAGVTEYQVNGPQIEDVFLSLAGETKDLMEQEQQDKDSSDSATAIGTTPSQPLQLSNGMNLSFMAQTWVLLRKRWVILKANPLPYLAALLIPIIAAGLVTLFLNDFSDPVCLVEDRALSDPAISLQSMVQDGDVGQVLLGPEADVPTSTIESAFPELSTQPISGRQQLQDAVDQGYNFIEPGGAALDGSPLLAWRADDGLEYAITAQNLMDVSLTDLEIGTGYRSFDSAFSQDLAGILQFILYFGLAMSAYPGFFALYVNNERLRTVRGLHYSNGVRAGPLWLAYTLFDFSIVLVVSIVAIAMFIGVSSAFYGPGYMFVVFVLYGLSAMLMAYVASLFTTSQLATFAFASGGQCCFFLLYFLAFMLINTYAQPTDVDSSVDIAHYVIALFFPAGNLLRALLMAMNVFSLICDGDSVPSYPGEISLYGSCILFLIIQIFAFFIFLVWWDSGYVPPFLAKRKHREQDTEEVVEGADPEIIAEAKRTDSSKDELRVLHASKVFGNNAAVQDITFGVPKGQVFALLGPNGAGKSTTMNMIRGDTRPTGSYSDIKIEDVSIISQRAAARNNLGVCPQHDAMDQMTAIEHLRFYARARGVDDVEDNVAKVLRAVGLEPFKSRMAGKLSGGNKRKLSLGIALMGNPSVILLDEPSSGMDAASKRIMWRTLQAVSGGRALVLTTHSMEEADALADRAGIMARKMLALGTGDQLRKKHSDALHVHLVHKDAPHTSEADMETMKRFVLDTFPGADTEDRSFHGQFRFSVPLGKIDKVESVGTSETSDDEKGTLKREIESDSPARTGISALFAQLEANKEKLGFEYYSVSQATLDQVFLSIVGKHNVQEENYQSSQPKKAAWWRRMINNA